MTSPHWKYALKRLVARAPILKDAYGLIRPASADHIVKIGEKPLVRSFLGRAAGDVLEVGYGSGPYVRLILGVARSYHGMDLSGRIPLEGSIAKVQSRRPIRFMAGEAGSIPFASGVFDTVVCTQVLEHIPNDLQALEEFARVLRSDGRAVIGVPTPPPAAGDMLDLHGGGGHVRYGYSLADLSARLNSAGFTVARAGYCAKVFSRAALALVHTVRRRLHVAVPSALALSIALLDRGLGHGDDHNPYGLVVEAVKRNLASSVV